MHPSLSVLFDLSPVAATLQCMKSLSAYEREITAFRKRLVHESDHWYPQVLIAQRTLRPPAPARGARCRDQELRGSTPRLQHLAWPRPQRGVLPRERIECAHFRARAHLPLSIL